MAQKNNGQTPIGVPRPTVKLFLTQFSSLPVIVPPQEPGVACFFDSGDLQVNVMFPAEVAEDVCEGILRAAHEATDSDSGIILPAAFTDDDAEELKSRQRRLRGEDS